MAASRADCVLGNRAIAAEHAVLEPECCDALTREQMRIDLEELWLSTRKTVIFITHSIDEAVLLADRVIVMTPSPGRIDRIIEIDLERPRGIEGRKTRTFTDAVEEITEIFLANGTLHTSRPVLNLLQKKDP